MDRDPDEQVNVAGYPENRPQLEKMRRLLKSELERFPGRPYGEFVPGGNAAPVSESAGVSAVLKKAAQAD